MIPKNLLSKSEILLLKNFFEENYMQEIEMLLQNSVFSAQQISTLINDLLDLAKLEKGEFTFNNEYFNMRETILKGIQQVQYMATQK